MDNFYLQDMEKAVHGLAAASSTYGRLGFHGWLTQRRSQATSSARPGRKVVGLFGNETVRIPGRLRGAEPLKAAGHCLSVKGGIPSSAVIRICGQPLPSDSAATSHVNFGVKRRRTVSITLPS